MLTGQAKKDYQREYMRKRRAAIKDIPAACERLKKVLGMPAVVPIDNGSNTKGLTGQVGSNAKIVVRSMTDLRKKWTGPLTKERQTSQKGFRA